MPFRQLKSFLKILIGVQYHCIAINPGMPAEYPQKWQSFRLHRYFRCGRQDSSTLWSTRRKRRVATVHRTVAFTWVRARRLYQNKKGARRLLFYFGAGDRTRTCTAKPEEPKSTESTNSTTPAYCLQPGYFIMGTRECQWTAAGTLEISRRKRAVFTIFVIFVLDIPARCL